jgi:hypothetical protein
MKKVIRLTESELVKIVKRIIKEDASSESCPKDVLGFQKWMNTNKKFWYKGQFNINKENTGVWGVCESETKKAWMKYKDEFLKSGIKDLPEIKVTPKVPSNLGFTSKNSPIGQVLNWKNNERDYDNPIANTRIGISPNTTISKDKNGIIQLKGELYFDPQNQKRKQGEKSIYSGVGPESKQAILGKSIDKTIWFDCKTGSFYVWYDNMKVIYSASSGMQGTEFGLTLQWFQSVGCKMASQEDLRSIYNS